jgi:hypothetical protein
MSYAPGTLLVSYQKKAPTYSFFWKYSWGMLMHLHLLGYVCSILAKCVRDGYSGTVILHGKRKERS